MSDDNKPVASVHNGPCGTGSAGSGDGMPQDCVQIVDGVVRPIPWDGDPLLGRLRYCRRCGAVFVVGAPGRDVRCPGSDPFGSTCDLYPSERHSLAPLSTLASDPPEWAKEAGK